MERFRTDSGGLQKEAVLAAEPERYGALRGGWADAYFEDEVRHDARFAAREAARGPCRALLQMRQEAEAPRPSPRENRAEENGSHDRGQRSAPDGRPGKEDQRRGPTEAPPPAGTDQSQALQRLAAEKREARAAREAAFEEAIERRFQRPEQAKAALRENRRRHGDARGIDALVRPESYDSEMYARPGPVRLRRQHRAARRSFERGAFALEQAIEEEGVARRVVAEGPHDPPAALQEALAEEKVRGLERAVEALAEDAKRDERLRRLESLAARRQSRGALQEQAARARARFKEALSQVYHRPEQALENFEARAASEGFAKAIQEVRRDPRSIEDLKGTAVGGGKTGARKRAVKAVRHLYRAGGNHLAHAAAVSALRQARLGACQEEALRVALGRERQAFRNRFGAIYRHPEVAYERYREAVRDTDRGREGSVRLHPEPERFGKLRGGTEGFLEDDERFDARRAAEQADDTQRRIASIEACLSEGHLPSEGAREVLERYRTRYRQVTRALNRTEERRQGVAEDRSVEVGAPEGKDGHTAPAGDGPGPRETVQGRPRGSQAGHDAGTRTNGRGEFEGTVQTQSASPMYGRDVRRSYQEELRRLRQARRAAPSRERLEERAGRRWAEAPSDVRREAEDRIKEKAGARESVKPSRGNGPPSSGKSRNGRKASGLAARPSERRRFTNWKYVEGAALATALGMAKKAASVALQDMGGLGRSI